jgi:hypothetical protein
MVFDDTEIACRSVDALVRLGDRADVHVIENYSQRNRGAIRAAMMRLLKCGSIKTYIGMHGNIGNNAFEIVLQYMPELWRASQYLVITDGDLVPDRDAWLDEECGVLHTHNDVWACGITLDLANLPVLAFPDAHTWVDPGLELDDYRLASTGLCLLALRTQDMSTFIEWHKRRSYPRFGDTLLRKYAKTIAIQKWAATKLSRARHLTWDRYADRSHEYTKFKTDHTFQAIWGHHKYCSFSVMTNAGHAYVIPWRHIARGWRRTLVARTRCMGRPKPAEAWW